MKLFTNAFLALFGITLAAGCGGASVDSICDRVCECEQCTDADRTQCVSSGEQFENQAVAAGCQDQYDEYLSCLDDNLVCTNGEAEASGCGAAVSALDSCVRPSMAASSNGGL